MRFIDEIQVEETAWQSSSSIHRIEMLACLDVQCHLFYEQCRRSYLP